MVGVTPEKGKSSERKRKRKTAMESGGDAGRSFLPAGALYGDDNNQNLSSNN